MPHFVRCIEGHVFDAQSTSQCPICGATVVVGAAAPMPEAVESAQPSLVAATSRASMLLVTGGIGLGLLAAAAATWIFLRPPAAATHLNAQSTAQSGPAPSTPKTPSTVSKSVAALSVIPASSASSLRPADVAPVPPEAPSNPVPSTAPVPGPALTTGPATSANSLQSVNPAPAPLGAPSNAVSLAPAVPLTATPGLPPQPATSAIPSQQANLQSSPSPLASDLNSRAVTTGPLDGEHFKAAFENALDKLGALVPIEPDVINIAVGIAGLNLFDHGEEQAGLEMLQQAAASNVPFAAAALGQRYFNGTRTLQRDYAQAYRWFDVASLADVPVANYELAVMYVRGLGVRRDFNLAGHYFLAAYHGGFASAVQIVTAARRRGRAERELLHRMGLDPAGMGMTVLEYYDARRATDPAGALAAIKQLAAGLQTPAPHLLAMAEWDGDSGTPDRAAAVKNFLVAARGGAFGALIPVAEASIDGTLGAPNPAQAGLVASLARQFSKALSAEDLTKLDSVYKEAFEKATLDQQPQLEHLTELLSQIAVTGSDTSARSEPGSRNP